MADLTPGELAKIDQVHAAVMNKLAELVSSAADGIREQGEPLTASDLAGHAQGTDHTSVATLLAAALIRLARHQMADQKRGTLTTAEDGYESEHYEADGSPGDTFVYAGETDDSMRAYAIETTTRRHNDPEPYPYAYSRVIRYTDRTYRTVEETILELGTKPEATDA